MNENKLDIPEDEINFKEIFWTLTRYRMSILFFITIFTITAVVYAYFKPDIYQAVATVEVGIENKMNAGSNDVVAAATSAGYISPDTEIAIIKSRFLVIKALKNINFTHHYYRTTNMKEFELYKNSPFTVDMIRGEGLSFEVSYHSKNKYRLVITGIDNQTSLEWKYDKIHTFDKEVNNQKFIFTLTLKKGRILKDDKYRFIILSKSGAVSSAMGRVNAQTVGKFSSIISISYTDNVALRAKEFTNALAEAYIKQSIDKKNREASKTLAFVDGQLDKIDYTLQVSELKLEEFKKDSRSMTIDAKALSVSNRLDTAQNKMATLMIQIGIIDEIYKDIKLGKSIDTISVTGLENNSNHSYSLASIISNLQETIIKIKELRIDYTDEYPEVKKLKEKTRKLKSNIISVIKNIKRNFDKRKKLLDISIEKGKDTISELPEDERKFVRLKRKFEVNEKIYSYLLEKQASVSILKASTVSNNRILDKALLPRGAISPKRKIIVITGFILGLLFAVAFSLLRAFLDDRIKYENDVTKIVNIPILGVIPHIKHNPDKVSLHLFPKSIITEAFRSLRTNLNFMLKGDGSHTIAVTSTISSEGKTTVCVNLASIMSMSNKKTIIVNLDMRKPTLHQKFGIKNDKGMSTLLSYRTTLSDVIYSTDYKNLDIIPAGPTPPNPSELIQDEFMIKILNKLKKVYDVIIIDTPPIGIVTDARMLIHLADSTIYVARAEYSKKSFLKNIEKISIFKDIKGLGIVINDMKNQKYGYEYTYDNNYYEEKI